MVHAIHGVPELHISPPTTNIQQSQKATHTSSQNGAPLPCPLCMPRSVPRRSDLPLSAPPSTSPIRRLSQPPYGPCLSAGELPFVILAIPLLSPFILAISYPGPSQPLPLFQAAPGTHQLLIADPEPSAKCVPSRPISPWPHLGLRPQRSRPSSLLCHVLPAVRPGWRELTPHQDEAFATIAL
ncbi:hypothetical protein FDECE_16700 [Fusarium decemcellulare]|nr:hypothetical protein FDECE_16700 [Fusarium decemcellulare]